MCVRRMLALTGLPSVGSSIITLRRVERRSPSKLPSVGSATVLSSNDAPQIIALDAVPVILINSASP